MVTDFGRAADDYDEYRAGFPESIMSRLASLDIGLPGQDVLDVGTGTGLFALQFARRGCRVTGIDPSGPMLDRVMDTAGRESLRAEFLRGTAETLPFRAATFDVVTVATAWHWFDKRKAASEAHRVLRIGGKLVVAVLEWHLIPGNLPSRTMELFDDVFLREALVNRSTMLYPEWTREIVAAGFKRWEVMGYVEALRYTHEGWRGRVRASQGVGPRMEDDTLAEFDRALGELLIREFPNDPLQVEHHISALVAW
jgi:SAM-dependent methyltransferase